MTIENQVCSLELAKQLKKLGVKQNAYHYWYEWSDKTSTLGVMTTTELTPDFENAYSAYTVAELGEMLPVTVEIINETYWFDCWKTIHTHRCGYTKDDEYGAPIVGRVSDAVSHAVGEAKTEADARARMLIYLLENKLIENVHLLTN